MKARETNWYYFDKSVSKDDITAELNKAIAEYGISVPAIEWREGTMMHDAESAEFYAYHYIPMLYGVATAVPYMERIIDDDGVYTGERKPYWFVTVGILPVEDEDDDE